MVIEVEVKALLSKDEYENLAEFFHYNADFLGEDKQETWYFDCPEDIRIQKNTNYSKIIYKSGKIHDQTREEIEIKFDKNDFEKFTKILDSLGIKTKVKWFRHRKDFNWEGVKVSLDFTKGYGYILELEKISDEKNKEEVLEELKDTLKTLDIKLTPREIFDEKFDYYVANWKELV